jgi:hypothetical protein
MVKDFIQYTEALELKQLGFDEPCFAFYDESLYFPNNENQYGTFCNQKLDASSCSAPTYSQAFRWFRDNGKVVEIFSQLLPSNKYKWGFKIQGVEGITDGFFTYEEAELACLKEMIKTANNNYEKQ